MGIVSDEKKGALPDDIWSAPAELFDYVVWTQNAACQEIPTDYFFMKTNASVVKNMCMFCPSKTECLIWALIHSEQGVWGGTTEDERKTFSKDLVHALTERAKILNAYFPRVHLDSQNDFHLLAAS